jgi:diacylglycerol kinase (ATP)
MNSACRCGPSAPPRCWPSGQCASPGCIGPEQAASLLAAGRRVILHPGLARWPDGRERLFVQMLGAGFDAAVVGDLDLAEKRRLGKLAYVLESARQLRRYGFPTLSVALDGATPRPAGSVIVSKGRYYAGRFRALPGATPLAPGFSVLVFETGGPLSATLAGAALPLNLLHRVPGARLLRAAQVQISGAAPAQADGDACDDTPAWVGDSPHPLPILVP